jgi:hypothetical protein
MSFSRSNSFTSGSIHASTTLEEMTASGFWTQEGLQQTINNSLEMFDEGYTGEGLRKEGPLLRVKAFCLEFLRAHLFHNLEVFRKSDNTVSLCCTAAYQQLTTDGLREH